MCVWFFIVYFFFSGFPYRTYIIALINGDVKPFTAFSSIWYNINISSVKYFIDNGYLFVLHKYRGYFLCRIYMKTLRKVCDSEVKYV